MGDSSAKGGDFMPDIQGVSWYGFVIVCGFIAADFLLGIARAFMQGEYKSSVLCKGLARKGAFVVVLLLAAYIEWAATVWPPMATIAALPVFDAVAIGVAMIEVSSIVENIVAINPDLADAPFWSHFASKALPSGGKGETK